MIEQQTDIQALNEVLSSLSIIKVSGKFGTGKTIFGLMAPTGNVLHLDTEFSSEAYKNTFDFTRMEIRTLNDLRVVLGIGSPTTSQTQREIFTIGDDQFNTIVLDTVPTVEDWLFEEVYSMASGYSANNRLTALGWGELKRRERSMLLSLKSKCRLLILTAHMRMEFIGKRPSGRYEPKGKETIAELASLSLILERKDNNPIPSAIVEKSRLITSDMKPMLPPRIPVCTWDSIIAYLLRPPNWDELTDEEKSSERLNIQQLLTLLKDAGMSDEIVENTA